jgi:hypothetical protein
VIEPRKGFVVGADVVIMAEASTEAPEWPGAEVPPGSKSRACAQWGSPATWESLPSRFVVLILHRVLKRLHAAWPRVSVELRADTGFAVPRLYAWCEANGPTYTIGMIPDRRRSSSRLRCSPTPWPKVKPMVATRSDWPVTPPIELAPGPTRAASSTKPKRSVKAPIHALLSPHGAVRSDLTSHPTSAALAGRA